MTFNADGLLNPQIPHAKFLAQAQERLGRSWDGSSTGTGKTYAACAIIRHTGMKFVVLCPKLAIPTWQKTLDLFGLKAEFIINYDKLVRGSTPYLKYAKTIKDKAEIKSALNIEADADLPYFLRTTLKFPK